VEEQDLQVFPIHKGILMAVLVVEEQQLEVLLADQH
jgi:hypothetical protein